MKYFTETIDYPDIFAGEILPNGELWCYVSNTFLNGFINSIDPIKSFLLNRYTDWDTTDIGEFKCNYRDQFTQQWTDKYFDTKGDLYQFVIDNKSSFIHNSLNIFRDDIMVLGKVKDTDNKYVFFWFDQDVSDCCIGVFETLDPEHIVVDEFKKYIAETGKNFIGSYGVKNPDRVAAELPKEFFNGWVKF